MASPNNIAKLPRIKTGRRRTLAEILEMQQVLRESLLSKNTIPSARAQVARAWDVLEERKRVIRMRPKPKDVDVSPEIKKKRAIDAQRRRMYEGGDTSFDPTMVQGFDPSIPRPSDPGELPPDNSKASPDAEIQLPKIEGWQPLWAQHRNG
jgi:hypothetical protein